MTDVTINISGKDEYPEYLRMLIVGQPGVGKTTFASKFPNPIWVNAGCGITTLAKMGDVPYVNVSSEVELFGLKQLLDRDASERENLIGRPVDTLVVDTVDELQRLLLAERLVNEKRSETKLEDWGWLNTRFHAIFGGLTQLPMNVVFIAHTKDVSVGDDTIFKPALAGQFCEHIHEYVDMSLWMRASTFAMPELGEITIGGATALDIGVSVTPTVARWVMSTPTPPAEWVNDKTGTLPPSLEVTDDVFDVIHGLVTGVTLGESSQIVVSESAEEVSEPEVQEVATEVEAKVLTPAATDEVCTDCGATLDSKTWSDLSKMRFGVVLCGPCFKTKDK